MKVEGSYESVVRGVSQQSPHQRFSGQHTDQVNLLSDTVEGLVRRRGSRLRGEFQLPGALNDVSLGIARAYRTHKWNPGSATNSVQVAYKSKAGLDNDLSIIYAVDQVERTRIPTSAIDSANDAVYQAARNHGISAITSVGRFLFMAVNKNVGKVESSADYLAPDNRGKVVCWVRGGAYARTFTVTLLLEAGGQLKFNYTTMASSYPVSIDTSTGLTPSDPEYQNKLSKIVADYNSATTKWIGDAAKDIQAENIAVRLVNGTPAEGNTGSGTSLLAAQAAASGIHQVVNLKWSIVGSSIYIQGDNIREIVVNDGGDTSLIRGIGNEVSSADLVSIRHWYGKIVKVRARKSDDSDAYYLKAESKNDSNDPVSYSTSTIAPNAVNSTPAIDNTVRGEVVWKEAAGYVQKLVGHLLFGYHHTDHRIYITSDIDKLATTLSIEVPRIQPNLCGDDYTNPPPNFATKQITYLGVFQDRLIVGSGSAASCSRPGDYLNFFRQSVLTITDTDPIDMFALGAEDDILRHSALFDKSLFLFGDKRQYVINGRTVLTPMNQNMTVVSQFPNTTGTQPQGSGNFIFYTKPGDTGKPVISLNQMQYGQIADSTESYDLSQPLTDFCSGTAIEIVPVVSPAAVIIRPDTTTNDLYIFRYTDEVGTGRRLQAAWDRWQFAPEFGTIISIASFNDDILMLVLRTTDDKTASFLCIEQISLRPAKALEPYFDSWRPCSGLGSAIALTEASTSWLNSSPTTRSKMQVVVTSGRRILTGTTWEKREQLDADQVADGELYAGIPYSSYVVPTNPYQRDKQGNAILQGRLILTQVMMSFQDTAAFDLYVKDANRVWLSKHFNGFRLSRVDSRVGYQPVVNTPITALIGREVRECEYKLQSVEWLPVNLTAISWTGQAFRR